MTGEHLDAILKKAQAKPEKGDKEGFLNLPEGATVTLYVARDGVNLTVSRVEALRLDGELVYARTSKRETFAIGRSDLFAVAFDAAVGEPVRRAGFG